MKKEQILQTAREYYDPEIVTIGDIPDFLVPEKPTFKPSQKDHVTALICASLQYNFWYQTSLHRLNNVNSQVIKELVQKEMDSKEAHESYNDMKPGIIDALMKSGVKHLDKRIESINEVFSLDLEVYQHYNTNVDASIRMIETLPSFQKDPFFKKGAFALQFSAELQGDLLDFVVPADYQIPKVLQLLGIITYEPSLLYKIESDVFLQEGSKEELAIRSATILACDCIAKQNKCTTQEVDAWLFNQKDTIVSKHHLCDTTNY